MASLKGPGEAQIYDGSSLRIAIVHARWNTPIISSLVSGARKALLASGVKEQNIITQSVPGSYELPLAVQQTYSASQKEAAANNAAPRSATDLLSSASLRWREAGEEGEGEALKTVFDAVIAIGVLIKGETMHFEYIADAVSHGLMRVQLDIGVPVVFGLLTVLSEEQGKARAGMIGGWGITMGRTGGVPL
ncbi:proteasome subunit alpha type-7 [Physcia stellaris]|nr:proteasome subunit alpha type-7 [Physcia stellaris]